MKYVKEIRYPQVLDIDGNLVAILNRAYNIGYDKIKNGLWTASFTLPLNDSKLEYVQPKYHIEIFDHDKRIGRFIVNPKRTTKNESTREVTFNCEHVLSTLHSDILFMYHQYTHLSTRSTLEALLENQEVKHWELGAVSITRYFSYSWENEDSLLNAIMSVPKPFNESFMWTWDDSNYPFTLNLVKPSDAIKDVIVAGKNLKGIDLEEDPTNIVTRIYPLGFGEGVNQLNIKKVNGDIPYLQDNAAVAAYGVHKRVWVDKSFEKADSLKASAQAILDKYKTPIESCAIDAIDYSLKDLYDLGGYTVGDMLQIFDLDTSTDREMRVEKLSKSDIYGDNSSISLELGNRVADIGMTWADMQKKQLINDTYSQGATNIDSRDFSDNCDSTYPVVIRFPIPDDVVNVNEMKLTFETQKYRAYSKAIKGGGGSTRTSSSGGGTTQSTTNGGGSVESSSSDGTHDHIIAVSIGGGTVVGTPKTYFAGGGEVELKATSNELRTWSTDGEHAHTVQIPAHNHSVTIPSHTHDTVIPEHTHGIDYGIFESPEVATAVVIKVDGLTVPITSTSGEDIDLLPYLQKDGDGNISRGRYAEIVITPNNLARINATVMSRLFIQSRAGTVI